jgi:hypothetical protein
VVALLPPATALALAACGSGGGGGGARSSGSTPPSDNAALANAGGTVQAAMTTYLAAVSGCAKGSSPVVCLEAADLKLGNKVHAYANLLAGRHTFSVPKADLNTTLNAAQTLANSLEILGDAQPTQANYDQVLNTFDVHAAVTQLQGDVATLNGSVRP